MLQNTLFAHVMVRGQDENLRQRISLHDMQERQQNAVGGTSISGLNDDITYWEPARQSLPPDPMLSSNNGASAGARCQGMGALKSFVKQG